MRKLWHSLRTSFTTARGLMAASTTRASPVTATFDELSDDTVPSASHARTRAADASFPDSSDSLAEQGPSDGVARFEVLRSAVEREEHAAYIIRLRKGIWSGTVLWPLYFGMDYLMSEYVQHVSFAAYVWLRSLGWLIVIGGALALTYVPRLSPRAVLCIDTLVYGGNSALVALMCVLQEGVASPYAAGIIVILTVRAAFVAVPWWLGLWPLGVGAGSYPVIVLGRAIVEGQLDRLLDNPSELSLFALYNMLIGTAFGSILAGGHAVWALRRQVFEARNIGRYRLLRPIARGGMGEVWEAYDSNVRRRVALKILRRDPFSEIALRRFEREVQATTLLTHPNTIRIFDYGVTDDGLWYYAMELLVGEDLARRRGREGALEPDRCVKLMLQVCGALAEAHARGIVHRDIKPANVFLCRGEGTEDFVKVLDFGIAKRAGPGAATELTVDGRFLGTPAYVSPEVAIGRAADARSDVYGLGGLLYFLLTGAAPFGGSQTALLIAHAVEQPLLPSARLGTELDPELEAIVMRCLNKAPAERFADAGELLAALTRYRAGPGERPRVGQALH